MTIDLLCSLFYTTDNASHLSEGKTCSIIRIASVAVCVFVLLGVMQSIAPMLAGKLRSGPETKGAGRIMFSLAGNVASFSRLAGEMQSIVLFPVDSVRM